MSKAVLLVCASLSIAFGCQHDRGAPQQSQPSRQTCSSDSECSPDQLCVFRACSTACADDSHCDADARCFDTGRGSACVRLQDNACILAADCPGRTLCVQGRCVVECDDSTGSKCSSGRSCLRGVCVVDEDMRSLDGGSTDGAGGTGGTRGGVPQGSAAGLASAGDCSPGSAKCDGQRVIACDDKGRATPERTCAFVCRDGRCGGSCGPDAKRCVGNQREVCDVDGRWQPVEICSEVCTAEACAATCVEGQRRCSGERLMLCRGGQYVQERQCPFVCNDAACAGECLPGTTRCVNDQLATCSAEGRWTAPILCANACVANQCAGLCVPESQRCVGAGAFQVCDETGQWATTQNCGVGACLQGTCVGECTPGTTRCENAGAVRTCELHGGWGAATVCASQACVGGQCTGTCSPGSLRCRPGNPREVESCSPDGIWVQSLVCVDQSCSDGDCRGQCLQNGRRCDPDDDRNYQMCTSGGDWGAPVSCGDNRLCDGSGSCKDRGCGRGMSPDWYSATQNGGNPAWSDPRWGANAVPFASSSGDLAGGYIVLFDRFSNELAVSYRVNLGERETPNGSDRAYVSLTSNQGSGPSARDATLTLHELDAAEGPRAITRVDGATYDGQWRASDASTWLHDASLWRGDGNPSWVVSFRITLANAGVDPSLAFRIGVSVHAEGTPRDLSTPVNLSETRSQPGAWAEVNLGEVACFGRATLR